MSGLISSYFGILRRQDTYFQINNCALQHLVLEGRNTDLPGLPPVAFWSLDHRRLRQILRQRVQDGLLRCPKPALSSARSANHLVR